MGTDEDSLVHPERNGSDNKLIQQIYQSLRVKNHEQMRTCGY